MQKRKRMLVLSMFVLVCLVVAACGNSAPTVDPASSGPDTPTEVKSASLRIARESGPSSGLLFIADAKGFIKDQGLEYEIVSFANGAEAVDSLQANQINVAFGAADTFPIRGEDSGLLGLTAVSQQPSAVSIVTDSDITGPEDLKGKKIGIVPNTVSQFVLENMYMAGAGLAPGDYEVVATGPAEMVALMARGDINAFALWDPFPARAIETLGDKVKMMLTSGELGIPNTTYLLVSQGSMEQEEYKSAYIKLVKALQQAQAYLSENEQDAAQIIGEATQLTKEEVLQRLANMRLEVFMDSSAIAEIENYNKILTSTGAVTDKVDVSTVLDQSFITSIE